MVLGAYGTADQEARPGRSFWPKIKEQIRYDQGSRRMVKENMFLNTREAPQSKDAEFISPSRRSGREGFGDKTDRFAKALRGQVRNAGEGLTPVPGEGVVPKHGVQQPAGLPQPR